MGARETASRPNHQPLSADLNISAGKESGPPETCETRFSITCRSGVDCGDYAIPLTLPPRSRSCARKQPVSNLLPVCSFEIKACSGSKPSATDPLHPNSNEIKVCSGVAARTPFFAKKSKASASRRTFIKNIRQECEVLARSTHVWHRRLRRCFLVEE